jgi:hypothetical protein
MRFHLNACDHQVCDAMFRGVVLQRHHFFSQKQKAPEPALDASSGAA